MTAAKATAPAAKSRTSARSPRKTRAESTKTKAAAEPGTGSPAGELEKLGSDVHSVTAREPLRSRLAGDVEAFLAQGGNIEEVPKDYRADPPKRPQSTYGRGSI